MGGVARGAYQSPGPCERSELAPGSLPHTCMHMGHGVALTHELPQVRNLSNYRDPMGLQSCVPYSTFIYGIVHFCAKLFGGATRPLALVYQDSQSSAR